MALTRSRMKPKPKRSHTVPAEVRQLVLERDGYRCARCDRDLHGVPMSVHHRHPRGMGGTRDNRSSDPRNLVSLCGSGTTGCHGWIESHRDQARATGWLLRSLDEIDAPLITPLGTRITLAADGTRQHVWPADDRLPSEVTTP